MELNALTSIVNNGTLDGTSGKILLTGMKFEHLRGKICSAEIRFVVDTVHILGSLVGQEVFFKGKTLVQGNINF